MACTGKASGPGSAPAAPEIAVAGPVPSFEGVRFHKLNNLARREHSPALRRNLAAVREQLPEVVLT
jgi:hypothetical protein